jgi:hypothetical protein
MILETKNTDSGNKANITITPNKNLLASIQNCYKH